MRDLNSPAPTSRAARSPPITWLQSKEGHDDGMHPMKVNLPEPVAAIYKAVEQLEAAYPGRKFTPDGHLVGSIGEVVAAEALGLTLYPGSYRGHDAYDANGDVQIKMTGGKSVSLYATCVRLVVLKVISPEQAEIVYDGPGEPAWARAGRMQKNGQRVVSLATLRGLAAARGAVQNETSQTVARTCESDIDTLTIKQQ